MLKSKQITRILLPVFFLLFVSCKKTAGEGGKAFIYGKIIEEDWNQGFTVRNSIYAAADKDVFIIYGDDVTYGDKVSTNYKGEFEFRYLRKGRYQVYVYSKDPSLNSASGDTVYIRNVEISGTKQKITIDPITVYN